jgi:hypothetical protein
MTQIVMPAVQVSGPTSFHQCLFHLAIVFGESGMCSILGWDVIYQMFCKIFARFPYMCQLLPCA